MKTLMIYIVLLIFITLLVMPLIFLNKDPKIFDNNYNVEYHFGITSPPIKEKSGKTSTAAKGSSILMNETATKTDEKLDFEDWMMEPLNWEIKEHK